MKRQDLKSLIWLYWFWQSFIMGSILASYCWCWKLASEKKWLWQKWALMAVADIRLDDQTVVACADVKLPAHRANLFIRNITGGSIPILNYAHTLCKFLQREHGGRAPRQFSMPSIAVSQVVAIKRDTSQCPPPSPMLIFNTLWTTLSPSQCRPLRNIQN